MINPQDMRELAAKMDLELDRIAGPNKMGFVLLVFPYGTSQTCNYISSCQQDQIPIVLREAAQSIEGASNVPTA